MLTPALVVGLGAIPSNASSSAPPDVAPGASASALTVPRVTAAMRSSVPLAVRNNTARLLGPAAATQRLNLTINLKSRNQAAQDKFLKDLQTKGSPSFHKFLTAAQWNARFAPTATDEAAVLKWAQQSGFRVTQRYTNRLIVDVDTDVATAQKALGVQINRYALKGVAHYANASAPKLPANVSSVVESVQGLDDINVLQPASSLGEPSYPSYSSGPRVQAGASAHANGDITKAPAALRAARAKASGKAMSAGPKITGGAYDPTDIYSSQAYDTNALNAQGHCCNPLGNSGSSPPASSIAVATAGQQQVSDMQGFQAQYPYLAYFFNEVWVGGTPACCDSEGTMDLEWTTAMANSFGSYQDTSHIWMYDATNSSFGAFNNLYNQMLSDGHARVMSVSWGCVEFDCYDDGSMNSTHNIFNSMLAQGWTLIAITHDHGSRDGCGTATKVDYPGSDPDVLAVGGSQLRLGAGPVFNGESAWQPGPAGCANNDGGGGGGCSAKWSVPSWQLNNWCGGVRSMPDVVLNADWYYTPQNVYFNGGLGGNGGTSIVAPEISGFMAQANAYALAIGGPLVGHPGYDIYSEAVNNSAPHNPYYDINDGTCNPDFCAINGYDRATGWGSFNMLQLAWTFNWFNNCDFGLPAVSFSGPSTSVWYNTDQYLSWTVADSGGGCGVPTGVAGFSQAWDSDPGDVGSHATPGAGDSFYSGPQFPNATSGYLYLSWAGQGCHLANVRAWDNMGYGSDNTYGYLCYDTVAPAITKNPAASLAIKTNVSPSGIPVKLTWAGTDATSGVATYTLQESVDGGAFSTVASGIPTASKTVTLPAGHTYNFQVRATDYAGNSSPYKKGKAFKLSLFEENNGAVAYSTGWTRVAQSGASGGFVKDSTVAGKTATFSFTGRYVAWVSTVAATNGDATVQIDGGGSSTVHTHGSSTNAGRLVYSKSVSAGAHTVTVTNLGTAGHSRVDVDAFVVIS
jgi:hypothetical protein